MTRALASLPAAILVAAALTGCGLSPPSPPPAPGTWARHPYGGEAPFHSGRMFSSAREPNAENASLETPADTQVAHPFITVGADGTIRTIRLCGSHGEGYDPGPEGLRKVLAHWPETDDEHGSPARHPYVLLTVDRQAPWPTVETVLDALVEPEPWKGPVWIGVAAWPSARPHHLALEIRPSSDPGQDASHALDVRLVAGEGGQGVTLEIGDQSWRFPPTPADFGDPAFLDRANVNWRDVKRVLARKAADVDLARLRVKPAGDEPRWAYVVAVLDLLLGVRVHEVEWTQVGLSLTLQEPSDVTVPTDEPAVGWWMLPGAVGAVLLAFLVTFLPLAIPRRRRKR